jgi:hypothetical protein
MGKTTPLFRFRLKQHQIKQRGYLLIQDNLTSHKHDPNIVSEMKEKHIKKWHGFKIKREREKENKTNEEWDVRVTHKLRLAHALHYWKYFTKMNPTKLRKATIRARGEP